MMARSSQATGQGPARTLFQRPARLFTALLLALLASAAMAQELVRVREIRITGLPELSRSERRGLLSIAEGDSVSATALAAQPDTVRSRLARLDRHPFARLTAFTLDTLAAGRAVNVAVTLDPGPEARTGEVTITGPGARWENDLRDRLATSTGDPFLPGQWAGDLDRAARFFQERGYPFARAETGGLNPVFAGDSVTVSPVMHVVPGARVTVDRVDFAGLDRTRPRTARRVAQLPMGRNYHPARVDQARRRLLRTEWFRDVSDGQVFLDRDGHYGVLFQVQEQPASSVAGAVGYAGEDEGVAGSLDASLNNLFGGGRAFDLHWRRDGPDSRAFSVGYLEPWVFGSPVDLHLALDQEVRDSLYVAVELAAEALVRLADTWTASGSLRRRGITADSLATDAADGDYTLTGLGAALTWDSRDRPRNPRDGAYARLGSERLFVTGEAGAGGTAGDPALLDDDLLRNTLDAETVLPLRGDWLLYGALHGAGVRADGGGRPPYAEWVELGGIQTVRGFAERSLVAPTAGWATAELRYLLGPLSRAFALADVAGLDNRGDTRWEWSVGTGVQVDTGVGLLSVAVAVPGGEGFSAAVVHARAEARF